MTEGEGHNFQKHNRARKALSMVRDDLLQEGNYRAASAITRFLDEASIDEMARLFDIVRNS